MYFVENENVICKFRNNKPCQTNKRLKVNTLISAMESAVATALKLGDTKIIGKCVGVNPATGREIIFSQDFVHIYVVPLDKIKIKTPLVRIKSGAIMPATLWGKFGFIFFKCYFR